jgi:hypothetical protein
MGCRTSVHLYTHIPVESLLQTLFNKFVFRLTLWSPTTYFAATAPQKLEEILWLATERGEIREHAK